MKLLRCIVLLLATMAVVAARGPTVTPSKKGQIKPEDLSYKVVNVYNSENATLRRPTGWSRERGVEQLMARGAGPRVIGGQEAQPCQFPYQAGLWIHMMDFGVALCGGSLISERFVLTAAHCVFSKFYKIDVILGTQYINREAGIKRSTEKVFLHGLYDDEHLEYDIAMLKLDEPVTFNECISPIELDAEGCATSKLDGEIATASGWGLVEDGGDSSNVLRWVDVSIISNAVCEETYGSMLHSHMCSTSTTENAQGVCNGDSGGPLVHTETGRQIGITSFVHFLGCESNNPHGYTRVSCFTDWIKLVKTL